MVVVVSRRPGSRALATLLAGALLLTVAPLQHATAADPGTSIDAACPAAVTTASVFPDVPATGTHAATITCLHGWDLVRGGADGAFRPGAEATRAQFAIVLHGLLERSGRAPARAASIPFTDVADTSVAREAIGALTAAGIIHGTTATTFSPTAPIDRGQMASLIARSYTQVYDGTMPKGPTFPDTVGTTHDGNIRRLVGTGITVGFDDDTFRPRATVSREQMVTFLARYLDLLVRDGSITPPEQALAPTFVYRRVADPARTVVETPDGAHVATFTDGARTVALAGPARTFRERDVTATVTSRTWVRLLPRPFDGRVEVPWLERARADRSPDVLATALEYVAGAPTVHGPDGLLRSSDAAYGPLRADGSRPIGSDWHDYQGVTAVYPTGTRAPRADRYGSVDCSGYIRLLFGVRFGMTMSRPPDGGASLPRVSRDQAADAPGIVPEPDRGRQITDLRRLQPGDLVFFDASSTRPGIDHGGIYLGADEAGRHRFISSRRSINGPTMGDFRGASLLDGTGLYARSFRSTRRL